MSRKETPRTRSILKNSRLAFLVSMETPTSRGWLLLLGCWVIVDVVFLRDRIDCLRMSSFILSVENMSEGCKYIQMQLK